MLCCYHEKPSPAHARLVDKPQPHQLVQEQCTCLQLQAADHSPQWCRAIRQMSVSQSGSPASVCFAATTGSLSSNPHTHLFAACVQGNRTSVSPQQQDEEHGESHDPAASISTRKTRYAADIIRRGLNKEGWKLVITGQRAFLLASNLPWQKGSQSWSLRDRPACDGCQAPCQWGQCSFYPVWRHSTSYGRSLGAGVAFMVAAKLQDRSLAETPY